MAKSNSIQAESGAVFADGERTVASHHDGGEFLLTMSERYRMPIGSVLAFIGDIEEEFGGDYSGAACDAPPEGRNRPVAARHPEQLVEAIKKIFFAMNHFRGQKLMFFHLILYALCQEHLIPGITTGGKGKGDKNGGSGASRPIRSQQDLAYKWHCSKANIAKNLKWLQEMCGIPERPDQRDDEARSHMETARRAQLNHKATKEASRHGP